MGAAFPGENSLAGTDGAGLGLGEAAGGTGIAASGGRSL